MKIKKTLFILIPVFALLSAGKIAVDRFEIVKNLDIFTDVYNKVSTLYVDDVKPGDLMKVGIDEMLKSLDPYTVYYPESEVEDYKFMTTGQYGGIGARIRKDGENILIAEPYEDSPARSAGLVAGDMIIEVDGTNVKGKSVNDMSSFLKGTPGTKVKLKVKRPLVEDLIDIEIIRKEIKVSSVPYHAEIDKGIGYIKLTSFTQNVGEEVKEALVDLKKNNNIQKLIFDLRDNGGGLLNEAVNIVNLFVSKNIKVVETKGRVESWNSTYKTLNAPIDKEIPVVILVNSSSASASEIVSGSLQDLDRAVIIGKETYGKGLVQTTKPLKYNCSIKVTTAKYYIPSGRCIQAVDYGDKDEFGKAKKIPDSLFSTFTTLNGRKVQDGHGIQPDVEVEQDKYSLLIKQLVNESHLFNFVTDFYYQNKTIESPEKFKVTDKEFNAFKAYLNDKKFVYESLSDKKIKDLEKMLEEEKFTEATANQLENLKKIILAEKEKAFEKDKEMIKFLLQSEIVTRYYFQKGRIINSLNRDPYIFKAKEILNNSNEYNKILGK
jgi:carboxyl-terminal processing protease